jgi:hypothetical protein
MSKQKVGMRVKSKAPVPSIKYPDSRIQYGTIENHHWHGGRLIIQWDGGCWADIDDLEWRKTYPFEELIMGIISPAQ